MHPAVTEYQSQQGLSDMPNYQDAYFEARERLMANDGQVKEPTEAAIKKNLSKAQSKSTQEIFKRQLANGSIELTAAEKT